MDNKLKLSEWLLENLEEKQSSPIKAEAVKQEVAIPSESDELKVGYADSYSTYCFYSFSNNVYGRYSFSNNVYSFSDNVYGLYSFSDNVYDLYSFSDNVYSLYYAYSDYYAYADYYFATCATCQICNTCQGKCETKQKVSDYIGALSLTSSGQGESITDEDWNSMVTWIKTGAPYNGKTEPSISTVTGEGSQAISKDRINEVNTSMASTFESASSGIATKAAGDSALSSDLVTMASTLNAAKISSTISCCQTSGGQSCIRCQDKCQSCQSKKQ